MSVVAIFSGSYCHGVEVASKTVEALGYRLVDDGALIAQAAERFQLEAEKLHRAMTTKPSVFNKFTHEKERALACLKATLADALKEDDLVIHGFASHLIPREIGHVLKTCLIGDVKYRLAQLGKQEGVGEKEALKRLQRHDEACLLWVDHLFGAKDPWAAELYDLLVPMGKVTVDEAVSLIRENVAKGVLQRSAASQGAVDDFVLAAQVELKLATEGHNVAVSATGGKVLIRINKHVLMLSSLEEELKRIAMTVPGVKSVETKVGAGYYQTDIYRKYDFDLPKPSKVLLVDDEREFAQTLSERLQMREYGSAVVYDGAEALSLVAEDEPEVMVLDLKMPGVDGLEVLRRVKQEHPNVEVIVLTGHGSKEIEKECMELGACAYLEKPVDMDTLTQKMQEAYKRLKDRKEE
mgnify:CR=1 FL=1